MAAVTARELLERYRRDAGPKPAARVERYLRAGGSNADNVFARYLRQLEEDGLAPGTIDLHYRTIRAFYNHFRLHPPQVRGWSYDPKDAERPALEADLIAHLVAAARAGELTGRQTALLALSTTYGMRAEELSRIQNGDVDVAGERIYIRTAKGGRPRWCWLPPQIAEQLRDSWPDCTANSVEKTFGNMWAAAMEIERPERVAWHSIRRALVRDLVAAGVPDSSVARYMRWANGGATAGERMVQWYSNPSTDVGLLGVAPARAEDAGRREYDADTWARHPYLALWQ